MLLLRKRKGGEEKKNARLSGVKRHERSIRSEKEKGEADLLGRKGRRGDLLRSDHSPRRALQDQRRKGEKRGGGEMFSCSGQAAPQKKRAREKGNAVSNAAGKKKKLAHQKGKVRRIPRWDRAASARMEEEKEGGGGERKHCVSSKRRGRSRSWNIKKKTYSSRSEKGEELG